MRQIRGARIGMVFQEPLSAFDPLFTIGQQLDEVLAAHTKLSKQERYKKVLDTLTEVELPIPQRAYRILSASIKRGHAPACHGGPGHGLRAFFDYC